MRYGCLDRTGLLSIVRRRTKDSVVDITNMLLVLNSLGCGGCATFTA